VWADTVVDLSPPDFESTHAAAVTPAGDIVGWGVPVDTSGGALRCLVWTLDGGGP
jgi:hypothetical protein